MRIGNADMTVFFRDGLELVELLQGEDDWDEGWFLEVLLDLTDIEVRDCLISARAAPSFSDPNKMDVLNLLRWEFEGRVAILMEALSSGQISTRSDSCP